MPRMETEDQAARSGRTRAVTGRLTSVAIVAGGWLIAGIRLVLDLIGYSTLPDDAKVASGLLNKVFGDYPLDPRSRLG